jgi:hypothetical protein
MKRKRNNVKTKRSLRMRTIKTTINPDLVINLIEEFLVKSHFINSNEEIESDSWIIDWGDAPFKVEFTVKEV